MMRFLALVALCTLVQLSYSADNGMFICKRVESECDDRPVIRKPRNNNNNIRLRPTQKSRPKPKPKPTASSLSILLEQRLRVLEERVELLERTSRENDVETAEEQPPPEELPEEFCQIWHRNRCFMFVEKKLGAISLEEAKRKCKEIRGNLANIYDAVHFRKVESFLREMIEENEEMEYFIVGMTFQTRTRTVLLRDGLPASYVTWYSDTIYPSMNKDDTRIHIQVNKMGSSPSGMYNVSPLAKAKSALCEIPRRLYEETYG